MNVIQDGYFDQMVLQSRELASCFREAADRSGISENEFWIWYSLIVLEGEQSQQEICTAWALRKQTVNTIVSGMVRKGYATLQAVPGTRNRKRICLTTKGRAYGEEIVLPVHEAEKRAFRQMPQEDRVTFLRLIGSYVAALRREVRGTGA